MMWTTHKRQMVASNNTISLTQKKKLGEGVTLGLNIIAIHLHVDHSISRISTTIHNIIR